ncbi:hypothetical protein ValSw41_24 [Vibrio phage ValSw4_1]|nr:hypothetical protein ValSw41_24 [Vibrio phage ValSw4_1]
MTMTKSEAERRLKEELSGDLFNGENTPTPREHTNKMRGIVEQKRHLVKAIHALNEAYDELKKANYPPHRLQLIANERDHVSKLLQSATYKETKFS